MRICILLAKTIDPSTSTEALDGTTPRPEYLVLQEALGADILSFGDVEASDHPSVVRARRRSLWWGLATLAFHHRKDYEHFYCTGEDIAFPFAALMLGVADLGRITTVVHNVGTPKWRALMRAVPSLVWRNIICLGESQRRIVVERNRTPGEIVHTFPLWVDTKFFDPAKVAAQTASPYVFACGRERRDYPMLAEAASGSELPFRVVASGTDPRSGFRAADGALPAPNVVVESRVLTFHELRDAYAGARVVAVPIQEVSYGAGVSNIVESMCMARPVVVTSSPGIVDYVEPGVSGLLSPVGEPIAFRSALETLFADPARASEMGHRNRTYAVDHFGVERYAARVAGLFGMVPVTGPMHEGPTSD
jgi:glycosyltransferase involved in cell wall biosynthesis